MTTRRLCLAGTTALVALVTASCGGPRPDSGTTVHSTSALTASAVPSVRSSPQAPVNLTPTCSRSATLDVAEQTSAAGFYKVCVPIGSTILVHLAPPRAGSWASLAAGDPALVQVRQTHDADGAVSAVIRVASSGTTTVGTQAVQARGVGRPNDPWRIEVSIGRS